jgi:hypothetical protein
MKRRNNIHYLFIIIPLFCFNLSCTKLDTKVYDKVTNFWRTPEEIAAGVAPAYSKLRDYAPFNIVYTLSEVSTDEIIVPNRGTDWGDDVSWEQMWKHTWAPNLQSFSDGWQFIYGGIANVNSIMKAVTLINPEPKDLTSIMAELKTVRSFYYFLALDLFGNVPIAEIDNTDPAKLGTRPRAEVFAYIEKELKDNLGGLSKEVNVETYGRVTQWFAQSLLAKLYLNAGIYTGTPRWTDCIAACDNILNSNKYILESDFFYNFKIANEGSRENIFAIPSDINAGVGNFWIQMATLHYNSQLTFGLKGIWGIGGVNGPCSTAEYYNLFNANDSRRKMFLVGQQYVNQVPDSAHLQYDRLGNLLNFDPVITSFKILPPKIEVAGARCAKWEFNKDESFNMSNDFAVFRLADIILTKAEAQFRNGDVAGALGTINQKIGSVSIRSRAGLPDFTATEMSLDGLLKERANELSWEGWRRNDLIRFGHFTDPRIPEKALSGNFRNLYPIPEAELTKNPYLRQNPGY